MGKKKKMRFFFDTEFIDDGARIELISLGVVSEDGREFYVENADVDLDTANDWVKANVVPHLKGGDARVPYSDIPYKLYEFAGRYPEFWGYVVAYDWVLVCQMFGGLMKLPGGWRFHAMDLKQLASLLGNPKLPIQVGTEHHALEDARWNFEVYKFLIKVWNELR